MSETSNSPLHASSELVGSEMVTVDMVWPDQSNHHGTLYGGAGLSMLDKQAFILGSRVLKGPVTTLEVHRLRFSAPAPVGHLIECQSKVIDIHDQSVTIDSVLVAENLLTGARVQSLSGQFTMVRESSKSRAALESLPAQSDALQWSSVSKEHANEITRVCEIVYPGHANHRKILHGGPAMAWMAKASFVAATRDLRQSMVMAASENMVFKASAFVGDVVEVTSRVVEIGRRSVHLEAQLWAESPDTGQRRHCASGRLTFVTLK